MTEPDFMRLQRQFAAHLRDPQVTPAPGQLEERRLKIYRDLFFNNVQNFIAQGFPVLRRMLDDDQWMPLVRRFFAEHACSSPYFLDIPKEFVQWLSAQAQPMAGYPLWLLEMAHYEYMELALEVSQEEIPAIGFNPEGDLLAAAPLVSPLVCVLSYQWPVHRIGPEFLPAEPEPTWLMVYRDGEDQVRFLALSQGTALLLQTLQDNPLDSGARVLAMLADTLGQPVDKLQAFGKATLDDLRNRGVILGTRLDDVASLSD